MADFDMRTADLKALNSLTKYPSIPTFHELDPRNGGLTETVTPFAGPVIGTEKVDGSNARIVVLPDGNYLLGSREELLYARGDLIGNPSQGIVASLRDVADALPGRRLPVDTLRVYFLELYGGRIGAQAKQYSTRGNVGWRLFDVAEVGELTERLTWPAQRIAAWRDGGGQTWATEDELQAVTVFDLTPRLFTIDGSELPADVAGMHAFLGERLPGTLVALDESGQGRPEGIVLRTPDRSVIAKARFQDYERTLNRRR
ncbi:RNA ligase family protein [Actinoplanes sp. NPDC020271]|uniref:RNA ligase family protein n=1 Tax=Actinoplanes sp. NPDC020271 TaxID=3363896 RepID=UPI0037A5CD06